MSIAPAANPRIRTTASRVHRSLAVSVGVADVRREPDGASEQVTQALLGASASPLEGPVDGWMRVRLADYEGWIRGDHLATPPRRSERVAVITAPRAPLYSSSRGSATIGEVYASSMLPIPAGQKEQSGRVRVALTGGRAAWLAADAVEVRPTADPFPKRGPQAAVDFAQRLLDTPYLWGGVTVAGIDCSGLTQLASRLAGGVIPRDADQQYQSIPWVVDRASVRLGDLLYFADEGSVTHVGIALDNMTLLHASGFGERVMITSLDPAQDEYGARLAGMYAGARRVFPEQGSDE